MTIDTGAGAGEPGNKDDGTGDGGAGKDDDKGEAQLAVIKGLTDQVTKMEESFGTVTETLQKMNDRIDASQVQDAVDDDDGEDDPGEPLTDTTIEQMTRPEYTKYLMGEFRKEVKTALKENVKPLSDKVETQANDAYAKDLKEQVDTLATDNKDFWDWKGEISEYIKVNPLLPIADAYALAKVRNPEKNTKLTEKYKGDPAGDEDNKGGKGKQPGFGGMKPNGGGKTALVTTLTAEQAAQAAFEDVFPHGLGEQN